MTARSWPGRLATWLLAAALLAMGLAARAETRVALVVGNSAYRHTAALANPQNDARDLAAALERTGFDVIVAVDAGKAQMDGALRAFAEKLGRADVALFYYAGHGLQVGNQNYLVPVDAQLQRERDLEFEAVRLDFVLRQMEIDREGKTTLVVLDACRDNPLSRNLARSMGTRSAAVGQGLAPATTGVGTFIAYSTQPGNVALDGTGRNSPFTAALLDNVGVRGRNLNATMIEVRKEVIRTTGGRQVPWDHSALTGDFYFVPGEAVAGTTSPAPTPKTDDVEALKARLAALEAAQAQQRQARLPGPDPARLAELRTRAALAQEQAKELQMKLLEARRIEGQARDPAERQRLQQSSLKLQLDMTRAAQAATRFKEELAKLESAAAAPAPPASPPPPAGQQPPAGPAGIFAVEAGHRAAGDELPVPPGTANCESRCLSEPRCVAYNLSKDGVCELLSRVTRTVAAANWRTATRSDRSAAAIDAVPSRTERGFSIYDNAMLAGDRIKFGAADGVAGCIAICRNTPGCVAGEFVPGAPPQSTCSVYRHLSRLQTGAAGATAFVKTERGARPGEPCALVAGAFDAPIALVAGGRLCRSGGGGVARVERVAEATVVFVVNDRQELTCRPGEVCRFDWPDAPQFTVRLAGGAGQPVTAEMVPARR